MANVTSDDVQKVINIEGDFPNLDIDSHITTADRIVAGRLSNMGYNTETLDSITLYLAAHFVSLFIREPEEKELADSRDKFTRELAQGLRSTRFGQTALSIEYQGVLVSDTNNKHRAQINVIL